MVALSIRLIVLGVRSGHPATPPVFRIAGFPVLFGSSIYSFMCHHSIPGMVTPVKKKERLHLIMALDYALILVLYYMITLTGIFAISPEDIQVLHSLNFFHPTILGNASEVLLLLAGIYLALFPVISLSSNFPIITVTLRDNLKSLFKILLKPWWGEEREFPWVVDRICFPLLALLPPTVLAFATQQDSILVSITGSFPGVGVQYLIPVSLAFMARYRIKKQYTSYKNPHRSPFSHILFQGLVVLWSVVSVVLIIVDLILRPPKLEEHPV